MKILLKRGNTNNVQNASLQQGELAVDLTAKTISLGTTSKTTTVPVSNIATKTSQLVDDIGAWKAGSLTKISQLTDDVGYWKKTDLSKVSQLTNDMNLKVGYCSYCTYCQQCSNCHNCTTINCNTVNCTTINCTTVDCQKCNEVECSRDQCNCAKHSDYTND